VRRLISNPRFQFESRHLDSYKIDNFWRSFRAVKIIVGADVRRLISNPRFQFESRHLDPYEMPVSEPVHNERLNHYRPSQ
jgi:hypothetical protein